MSPYGGMTEEEKQATYDRWLSQKESRRGSCSATGKAGFRKTRIDARKFLLSHATVPVELILSTRSPFVENLRLLISDEFVSEQLVKGVSEVRALRALTLAAQDLLRE